MAGFGEKGFDALVVGGGEAGFAVFGFVFFGRRSFEIGLALAFEGLDGLLDAFDQLLEFFFDLLALVFEFGEVEIAAGKFAEGLKDGVGTFGKRELGEEVGHFAEETAAAHAAFGGHSEEDAVEAGDLAVLDDFESEIREFLERIRIDRGTEDAGGIAGAHFGGHGGEGENVVDANVADVFEKLTAEGIAFGGRLGFADEDDQIVFAAWIFAEEKAAAGEAGEFDEAIFHFDAVELEKLAGGEFGELVHAEFCH